MSKGINFPSIQFYALSLGASITTVGMLFSLSNIAVAITRIPVGLRADKHGIKRITTYSFLGSFLTIILVLVGDSWYILMFGMLSTGLCEGIQWAAQKYRLSRSTTVENRSMAFSLLIFGSGSAALIGSAISGFLIQNFDFRFPLIFGSLITLSGSIISIKLSRIKPYKKMEDVSKEKIILKNEERTLKRRIGKTVWLITLFKTSHVSILGLTTIIYPLLFANYFQLDYVLVGLILALISIVRLIGLLSAGRIRSTHGRLKVLFGAFVLIPLFFCFNFVHIVFVAVTLILIIEIINAHITPTLEALMADYSRIEQVGLSFGLMDSVMRFGMAGGNIIGGFFVEHLGFGAALTMASIAASISSSVLIIIRRNLQ